MSLALQSVLMWASRLRHRHVEHDISLCQTDVWKPLGVVAVPVHTHILCLDAHLLGYPITDFTGPRGM